MNNDAIARRTLTLKVHAESRRARANSRQKGGLGDMKDRVEHNVILIMVNTLRERYLN